MEITAYGDNNIWNARLDSDPSPSLSQFPVDAISTTTELHITNTTNQTSNTAIGNFSYNGPKIDLTTVTGTVNTLNGYENDQLIESFHFDQPADLIKLVQDNGDYLWTFLSGNDSLTASLTQNINDTAIGLAGNDTFIGGGDANNDGNANITNYTGLQDWFNGGEGIDTAIFRGKLTNYTLIQHSNIYNVTTGSVENLPGFRVHDQTGLDGTDFLINVERLKFSDTNLALDIDGNAGKVAKILGAVFGANSVSNAQYVGIGLSLLDAGMSYSDLTALALNAAGAKTNDAIVTTLWTNVVGSVASAADKQPFIAMLEQGVSAGELGVMAADSSFNTSKINLVGLAQSGLEYI